MEVEKLKSGVMKVLRNKYLVAIILFFAWVVFFDENSIVYHQKNRHRLNEMNEQKVYYREKIQEDRQKLEDLNSGARDLEKFAREQYFMSKPKYIYIDDENDGSITSLINGFNDTGLIQVDQLSIEKGLNFSVLELLIKNKISDENYDGLLIDLRLDGEGPNQLEYSAISISSELRAICARNELKSFPIILCSTLDKIKETYKSDKTSHDLFDYTFRKSENPDYIRFSKKLKSLAEGYLGLPFDASSLDKIFQRGDLNFNGTYVTENNDRGLDYIEYE